MGSRKITDLEITNRVKEQFVELLQQERERMSREREGYVRELMAKSHRIGELETQVLQLGDGGNVETTTITDEFPTNESMREDFRRETN